MLPCLALAISICCAPLRRAPKQNQRWWLVPQAVALAFAAPAASPFQVGATRHPGREARADAGLDASGREPGEAASPETPAFGRATTAGSETSEGTDFEILRIEKDLDRINDNPAARRAFYNQIDEMVSRVRSGKLIPHQLMLAGAFSDQAAPTPVRFTALAAPAAPQARADPGRLESPDRPPAAFKELHSTTPLPVFAAIPPTRSSLVPRRDPEPHLPANIPAIESPTGSLLDPEVVSRLLYWANQNHCPAELALATAWQESHLALDAADGSSGEIGIMQILPARAKAEGVNPRSLRNPDVDMWLGTKLLGEYYQQNGNVRRAAMQYVAGPNVFNHHYPERVRHYIAGYSNSVQNYAEYFKSYVNF
ncbi:MAG: transglycosylase SLT domain-containing protein [Terriglobia bacterium]